MSTNHHLLISTLAIFGINFFIFCGNSNTYAFVQNNQVKNQMRMLTIHQAAEIGDEMLIEQLLRNGVNVNEETTDKWTPLHVASKNGHERAVGILLKNGANISAQEIDKWSPLHTAVRNSHEKVVELLLRAGANPNAEEIDRATPLHIAARQSNEKIVETLLLYGSRINVQEIDKSTPLHIAVQNNHQKVVEHLISYGANIKAENKDKATALHIASAIGNEKLVGLLIRNGANIRSESKYKWQPIHLAAQNGHERVIEQLSSNPLILIDAQEIDQWTALHISSKNGHEKAVEVLLRNGADKNAKGKDGWTPLHWATQNGREKIVDLLIKEGALKDIKDDKGQTPKDIAILQACQLYSNQPISYIRGGTSVDSGEEFPWMAALGYLDDGYQVTFDCGGTIISDRFVLTAAHCVKALRAPVIVRLGKKTLTDTDNIRAANYQIKEIIRHPNFSTITEKNDIALIRLLRKIDFTELISPACLQTEVRDEASTVPMIVTGWRSTSAEKLQRSNALMKAQLQTMPLLECSETMLLYNQLVNLAAFRDGISESQYCAYDPQGRNDSCPGDSGGPLQYFADPESNTATVVGIISFGIGCGSDLPGIYTRVAYYLNWIEGIVWPNA